MRWNMDIFKATFFKGGSHEIRVVSCKRITNDAVVFSRNNPGHFHNSEKIESRQHTGTRYCETHNEASRFIESRYQLAINELERDMKAHESEMVKLNQDYLEVA